MNQVPSRKYTLKMSKKATWIYNGLLIGVFIPMMAGMNMEYNIFMLILLPVFFLLVALSFVFRIINYCQLTENGLLFSITRECVPYGDIIGLIENGKNQLEVEYKVGGARHTKLLRFVSAFGFLQDLRSRMKE